MFIGSMGIQFTTLSLFVDRILKGLHHFEYKTIPEKRTAFLGSRYGTPPKKSSKLWNSSPYYYEYLFYTNVCAVLFWGMNKENPRPVEQDNGAWEVTD